MTGNGSADAHRYDCRAVYEPVMRPGERAFELCPRPSFPLDLTIHAAARVEQNAIDGRARAVDERLVPPHSETSSVAPG